MLEAYIGVPLPGGRRRPVEVIKTITRAFKSKIPRIHILRNQRVNTTILVRAIGAPGMLYGIDIVGASDTHLHSVRVAALKAALPPGASRNVDVAFAVLDASGGSLDPAYAAHSSPVKHWGLALWQSWAPPDELTAIFSSIHEKLAAVNARNGSVWAAVNAAFVLVPHR